MKSPPLSQQQPIIQHHHHQQQHSFTKTKQQQQQQQQQQYQFLYYNKRCNRSKIALIIIGTLIILFQIIQFFHYTIYVTTQQNQNGITTTTTSSNQQIINTSNSNNVFNAYKYYNIPYGSYPPKKLLPIRNDNNSTFSACLLIMDDNHFLIEWLTYHYLTLPLRYLIITVDPRSTKQSPQNILNRFRNPLYLTNNNSSTSNNNNNNNNNNKITIVRWNEFDFLPKEWLLRPYPNENDHKGKFIRHRERQRHFYPKCMKALHSINRTWTTIIDVDEFIMINPYYNNYNKSSIIIDNIMDSSSSSTTTTTNLNTSSSITSSTNTKNEQQQQQQQTRTKVIDIVHEYYNQSWACIMMPRVRFGTYEDNSTTTTTTMLEQNSNNNNNNNNIIYYDMMMTYKWKYRSSLNLRKLNRNPKSIINVNQIPYNNINSSNRIFNRLNTDAHRPIRSHCPQRNLYLLNNQSKLVVYHYPPISLEQYLFRNDARSHLKQHNINVYKNYYTIQHSKDNTICTWVHDLIVEYGYKQSMYWLHGVGNISYSGL